MAPLNSRPCVAKPLFHLRATTAADCPPQRGGGPSAKLDRVTVFELSVMRICNASFSKTCRRVCTPRRPACEAQESLGFLRCKTIREFNGQARFCCMPFALRASPPPQGVLYRAIHQGAGVLTATHVGVRAKCTMEISSDFLGGVNRRHHAAHFGRNQEERREVAPVTSPDRDNGRILGA